MSEGFFSVLVQGVLDAMACLTSTMGAVMPSSAVSLTVSRIQKSVSGSGAAQASLRVPCIQSAGLFRSNTIENLKQVKCAFMLSDVIR